MGFRRGMALLALLLGAAVSGTALADTKAIHFNVEDGVWEAYDGTQDQYDSDSELSPAAETQDKTGFVSGYIRIKKGSALYADADRTQGLGYPLEESIVYAQRRRVYEKGAVYELRFDTEATAETKKYITAYYYSRDPDVVSESTREEMFAGMAGARVVDGVPLTVIRFRYGDVDVSGGYEAIYSVVASSGTAYVLHDGTNLREGPGSTYGYIVRLSRDTQLTMLGMAVNGVGATWLLVREPGGHEGFIRGDMVTMEPAQQEPEATLEPLTEEEEAPAEEPETEVVTIPQPEEDAAELPEMESEADEGESIEEEPEVEDEAGQHSVRVALHWQTQERAFGDAAVLEAILTGYEDEHVSLQWQTSADGAAWQDVPGATGETLTLTMTPENYRDYWRVVVESDQAEIERTGN